MQNSNTQKSRYPADDSRAQTAATSTALSVFPLSESVPKLCATAMDLAVQTGYRGLTTDDQDQPSEWAYDDDGAFIENDPLGDLLTHLDHHVGSGRGPNIYEARGLYRDDHHMSRCDSLDRQLRGNSLRLHRSLRSHVHEATFSLEDVGLIDNLFWNHGDGYFKSESAADAMTRKMEQWIESWENARQRDGGQGVSDSQEAGTGVTRSADNNDAAITVNAEPESSSTDDSDDASDDAAKDTSTEAGTRRL
jgi:hypothetical protein